jgi:transcriptional regulator with XRE-family HTH domain
MDTRNQFREFLTSRRAKITPEQAGISASGRRRVPGLRREEVAVLAGISVFYYSRLERGDVRGVSDGVLGAVAAALQLDDADRSRLFELARAGRPTVVPRTRRPPKQRLRPSVLHMLDAMTGAAAVVRNPRLDVLAANALGRALYCEMFSATDRSVNAARFVFLHPCSRDFYADWEMAADHTAAALRAAAGRDPYDRCLSDLVGQLSTQSSEFRTRWAQRTARQHLSGVTRVRHPVVGDISLAYDRLELAADPGLTLLTYTPEPGSRDEETLRLLGSWAATYTTNQE